MATDRKVLVDEIWKSNWQPASDVPTSKSTSSNVYEKAVIDSLMFPNMDDRGQQIPKAYEKTFQWIFDPNKNIRLDQTIQQDEGTGFAEWLEGDDTSIYWITGKAGSGKSTLVKYIMGHPLKNDLLQAWAGRKNVELLWAGYYFWEAGGNALQRSREGMMQTLLYQCLRKRPDLLPTVCPRRWALYEMLGGVAFTPPSWTWDELNQSFTALAARSGTDFRLALFIDGLDEFNGDPTELISLIKNLDATYDVKICVASRPWTEFSDALVHSPSLTMQALTKNDILTYVRGHFESCRAYHERKAVSPHAPVKLIYIAERAEGVFLWVSLVVRSLKEDLVSSHSLEELRITLESLPQALSELYTKIWQSVGPGKNEKSSQFLQLKVATVGAQGFDARLLWVAGGETPPEGSDYDNMLEVIRPILTRKLDSYTKGILEVSHYGVIEFVHRTASDWIKQPEIWKYVCSKTHPDFDPSLALLEACNTYIFPELKVSYSSGSKFEFLLLAGQVDIYIC